MEIKIAVVVGDNEQYAAMQIRDGKPDWDFLMDSVGVYDEKTREMIYPTAERRYVVTASVELPTVDEVRAASVEAA